MAAVVLADEPEEEDVAADTDVDVLVLVATLEAEPLAVDELPAAEEELDELEVPHWPEVTALQNLVTAGRTWSVAYVSRSVATHLSCSIKTHWSQHLRRRQRGRERWQHQ